MFIYKITILPLNQVYIGLDTKPSYKLARWKEHCRNADKGHLSKLYVAMRKYGVENCSVEVIKDNFSKVVDLALAEIKYIKKYNSYKNGLNSTTGGDGLSTHLYKLSEEEVAQIKSALGKSLSDYNKNIKWANTTAEDRKELTKHLHTEEVYEQKSKTLKEYYKANPEERKKRRRGIDAWQKKNYKKFKANNIKNGLAGAAKVSVAIMVESPDGSMLQYPSKSEFYRQTKQWAKVILEKTARGESHNGYKAWEIKNE
jgi:hypothetical protein